MIDSIFLDNYKQFEAFNIHGLKRINIFSGQNNSGKTSILEAIFMLYDRGSPDLTVKQYGRRGVHDVALKPDTLWQPLFANFDLSKAITIAVTDNGDEDKVVYQHIEDFDRVVAMSPADTRSDQIESSGNAFTGSLKSSYLSS